MVSEHKIDKFISKVELGIDWFQEAGRILVEMLDENPSVKDDILSYRKTWMTLEVLDTFEMIGRNQLSVHAMFMPRHVLNHLIALPIDEQVSISTGMIPTVTGMVNGSARIKIKPAADLTRREAARAIGPSGVRTPEEQVSMLKSARKFVSRGLFDVFIGGSGNIVMKESSYPEKKFTCQSVRLSDKCAQIEIIEEIKS